MKLMNNKNFWKIYYFFMCIFALMTTFTASKNTLLIGYCVAAWALCIMTLLINIDLKYSGLLKK